MRQKQGVFSLFLLSPSSRRAWIEILFTSFLRMRECASPSSRRAWIEIHVMLYEDAAQKSPSSRRAWIEMILIMRTPHVK